MLDSAVRQSVGQPSTKTPRKLRDSCTDCASSKVKCSKEKPTCARCARRGVLCTYMVSRRTGRTSSNASKAGVDPSMGAPTTGSARGSVISAITGAGLGNNPDPGPTATGSFLANNNSNSTSTSNHHNETDKRNRRPSLRVGTPLLPHSSITASAGAWGNTSGHQSPDSISAAVTDTEVWSSTLTPSALIMDSAGLSPPLTTVGTDIGDLFDLGLHSPMMLDCPEQPSIAEIHTHTGTSDLFGDVISVSDPDAFSSHVNATSAIDWAQPRSPPDSCFTVVMDILARLFPNASSSCTLPGNRGGRGGGRLTTPKAASAGSRTIESVISENKQIIESLTNLLDCDCTHDEYLISIMAMAALKVMGWYAAAAADDGTASTPSASASPITMSLSTVPMHSSTWPGPSSISGSGSASPTHDRRSSASSSSGGRGPLGEQVLRLPTTVGNYCVAGQHQGRMAAQLVLSELHRVQRLVNALSTRLESVRLRAGQAARSGSSSGSSSVGEAGDLQGLEFGGARAPPLSVPTFCQLEEDLRKRLRLLSAEIIDALRRA